eukprot:2178151-Amphidinium_carterae.1
MAVDSATRHTHNCYECFAACPSALSSRKRSAESLQLQEVRINLNFQYRSIDWPFLYVMTETGAVRMKRT